MLNKCIRRYFFFPLALSPLEKKKKKKKKKKKTPDRRLVWAMTSVVKTSLMI